MSLPEPLKKEISDIIASDDVVLFMKGRRTMPQCGFSAQVVQILDELLPSYTTINVLSKPDIREGIKVFSSWPTIPQLYIKGEFVGGCDIVRSLHANGELGGMLGASQPEVEAPSISLSDNAIAALEAAREGDEPRTIRFEIGPDHQYGLGFESATRDGDFKIAAKDWTILIDRASARRAKDVTVDFVKDPRGGGFKIENAAEPPKVKQLSPEDLKAKLDANEPLEVFDVRTSEERQIARIEGTRLLDEDGQAHLEQLPKDTVLVFHCHHGQRSQAAAQHFLQQGFSKVFNLKGGIDAWSSTVDSSVPRY